MNSSYRKKRPLSCELNLSIIKEEDGSSSEEVTRGSAYFRNRSISEDWSIDSNRGSFDDDEIDNLSVNCSAFSLKSALKSPDKCFSDGIIQATNSKFYRYSSDDSYEDQIKFYDSNLCDSSDEFYDCKCTTPTTSPDVEKNYGNDESFYIDDSGKVKVNAKSESKVKEEKKRNIKSKYKSKIKPFLNRFGNNLKKASSERDLTPIMNFNVIKKPIARRCSYDLTSVKVICPFSYYFFRYYTIFRL